MCIYFVHIKRINIGVKGFAECFFYNINSDFKGDLYAVKMQILFLSTFKTMAEKSGMLQNSDLIAEQLIMLWVYPVILSLLSFCHSH